MPPENKSNANSSRHASAKLLHPQGSGDRASLHDLASIIGDDDGTHRFLLSQFSFPVLCIVRRQHLQREGDAFGSIAVVLSGTLMTSATDVHVVPSIAMRGDVVGLDGYVPRHYAVDVVAVENSRVVLLPFERLLELGREHRPIQRLINALFAREIARTNRMVQMLATCTALAKVSSLLLDLSEGARAGARRTDTVLFALSRRDMGRHLGISVETVSRTLHSLAVDGAIRLDGRKIEVRDARRLRAAVGASDPTGPATPARRVGAQPTQA